MPASAVENKVALQYVVVFVKEDETTAPPSWVKPIYFLTSMKTTSNILLIYEQISTNSHISAGYMKVFIDYLLITSKLLPVNEQMLINRKVSAKK